MPWRRSSPSTFERQLVNWSTSGFSPSTAEQYRSVIRSFEQSLQPRFLREATRDDVLSYLRHCRTKHARTRALAALHGFLAYLAARRKLAHDPSEELTIADVDASPTADEVRRLLLTDHVPLRELEEMTWSGAVLQLFELGQRQRLSERSRTALFSLLNRRFPGRDFLRDLGTAGEELIFRD